MLKPFRKGAETNKMRGIFQERMTTATFARPVRLVVCSGEAHDVG